jgi:uncharacterized protein (TIGR04255 family)
MSGESELHLSNAPIVEAVVDIDCDLPIGLDLSALDQRAKEVFASAYPKARRKVVQQHQIKAAPELPPEFSVQTAVDALQFLKDDDLQLVQVRSGGYSFNRLAPYSSLDDYLPEIERTWREFVDLVAPVQIRRIALRYINRILLPTVEGRVQLDDYLRLGPQVADEEALELLGFLHQQSAVEVATGNQVNTAMVMQPLEDSRLPLIFDIEAMNLTPIDPQAWENVRGTILSLRRLKNYVFRNTLTEQCLNLFR